MGAVELMALAGKASARAAVSQTVRPRVWQSYRTFHTTPALLSFRSTPVRVQLWRGHTTLVRGYAATLTRSWYSSWIPSWRAPRATTTPATAPTTAPATPPRAPRQLSVDQLVEQMRNHREYMLHGTNNTGVGTLAEPLRGIEEPGTRALATAPVGVYAFRGFVSSASTRYGTHYVVMTYSGPGWRHVRDDEYYIPGTDPVPDQYVVGWCTSDDLVAAVARRGSS
jgi:hypothetical protein